MLFFPFFINTYKNTTATDGAISPAESFAIIANPIQNAIFKIFLIFCSSYHLIVHTMAHIISAIESISLLTLPARYVNDGWNATIISGI